MCRSIFLGYNFCGNHSELAMGIMEIISQSEEKNSGHWVRAVGILWKSHRAIYGNHGN